MLRVSRQLSWGKLLLVFVIIAAAAMLSSATSFAAVTSTNANVDLKAPPPSSVLESDNANSSEIWIFQEKSVNLGSALAIDQANTNPSTTIASGTTINSYFIHLGKGGSSGLSGTVTFDEPILGVIKVNSKLDATDFLLGLPGTTYQVGNFRGLENNDSISFDDEFTINFTLNTPSHADQIRVITETVGAVTLFPPGHTWEYTFIDPTGDSSWNTSTGGWFTGPAPFGIPPGLNPSPLFFPGTVWDADISPIIVDIHAVENHPGNKVSVTLPPGSYDLTVIGPDDGGAFEAWNAWGETFTDCDNDGANCTTGWLTTYEYSSVLLGIKFTEDHGNFQTSALALAATDGTVIKLPIEQVVQFWNGDSTHEDNTGGVSVRITHRSSPGTICGCEQQST